MRIFGLRFISEKEYEELTECWRQSTRAHECYRWFSGWKDLDVIWDYVFGKSYGDVGHARSEYARERKTDEYGNKK